MSAIGSPPFLVLSYPIWTGSIPRFHLESLSSPVQVVGWSDGGLKLADGRVLMPAGMTQLPKQSKMLGIVTEHGVQVDFNRKMFGLVKLWHWCGNDSVWYDMRRVDLAQMLGLRKRGRKHAQASQIRQGPFEKTGGQSPHGWSISEYSGMKMSFDPRFSGESAVSSPEQYITTRSR